MSLVAEVCLAQTPPNLENGWKPFGSYEGSHLDTVNVMNGNLMFHAPLIPGAPGRGALTFSYSLYGSSKDWQAVCGPLPGGAIGCKWQKGGTGVSIHITPSLSVHRTINKQYMSGQGTTTFAAYGYTVIDADGASHPVHGAAGTEDVYGEATQFDTADLSGYHLALSVPDGDYPNIRDQFTVTDRSGTVYQGSFGPTTGCGHPSLTGLSAPGNHPPLFDDTLAGDQYCSQVAFASLVTDSNGNQVSIRGPMNLNPTVDTLGRNPLFTGTSTTDYTGCASAHTITSATLYFYQDPNGVTRQIKLCNALIHLQTAFNQPNPYNTSITVQEASQDSFPVVSVVLADGSHWTFDYDSYGELSSVVLPTGGSISYAWTTVDFNACDPQNNTQRSRAVASRTLNDGQGRSSTWFYSWGAPSGGQQTNVVTDPLGNDTKHIFSEISSVALPAGLTPVCRFYETATVQYQGAQSANQPMQRSDTTYVATNAVLDNGGPGSTSAPGLTNVFATEVLTTLYTNRTATKVKKVHKDPDPGLGAGLPIFGNTVKELVYDWKDPNPNVPWVLLRETDTVYQWQKNSNYLTANMVDLPASTVVIDPVAANNTKSGCPINATGGTASCIAQSEYLYDEAAYFTSPSPLITTQHVAPPAAVRGNPTTVSHWLNASSLVSSHTNWYDTGEPYQKIDPLGHTTTLSYDSAYVGAYVTQTCSPTTNAGTVTHCVIAAYDFNTGVLTSFTDQNGQTSNYEYDRMFRITSAQAPVDAANGGLRATTSLSYSTTSLPWSVTRTRTITSALTDSATSMFDGLGRGNKGQHPMPGGTATVDTVYDPAGRVASVTNPYFNTSDATYGVTQNIYDALDRPVLVQKQDGSFATVTYQDNCTLAEDEAGKARRTCADALGRLYEVEEPGDSSAPAATDTSTVSTSATAIVSIGGSEQMVIIPAPPCPPRQICDQTPDTVYDSGTV
ncbi:MAG: hypothetical protein LAO20_20265, partial [Acidobacteriia bacterium]|nr:hypothetical protein [Terriglobia bacterium]